MWEVGKPATAFILFLFFFFLTLKGSSNGENLHLDRHHSVGLQRFSVELMFRIIAITEQGCRMVGGNSTASFL